MSDPRSKPVPAEWRGPLHRWVLSLRAAGRSAQTVGLRRAHVAQLARAVGGSPTSLHVDDLVEWLGERDWGLEMRRSVVSSLRQWWRHVDRQDMVDALPKVRPAEARPRPLPDDALEEALARSDDRVTLILTLACRAGLRRGEIAQVRRSDLTRDLLGWSLLVHGKGGRERIVPLADDVAQLALEACRRGRGGWALPGRVDGHVSAAWVGKLAARALPGVWTLHTGRHRFATRVHDGCGDLIVVQQLLGHQSVATTQRYVATTDAALRAAVEAAA